MPGPDELDSRERRVETNAISVAAKRLHMIEIEPRIITEAKAQRRAE